MGNVLCFIVNDTNIWTLVYLDKCNCNQRIDAKSDYFCRLL